MEPLAKPLRRQLEDAVVKARDVAEEAARAALSHLGVGDADAPAHLTDEERALRRRLRVHGRQLGDQFLSPPAGSPGSGTGGECRTGHQTLDKLEHETAYEHWHRMLFARFLAENGLLMHPDGVALTLDECHELARDEGAADGWELAGRYASRMLPQIFRPDSPVLALQFAPEHQRGLERLLAGLDPDCFQASDSLGWVYQFWQTRRKAEVNASEVKIGADELPAVTQLFTEPYMVAFLLDNALGAWWAARRLSVGDLETADSEETLRRKAAIPGVPLAYLRFVRRDDGIWTPAAGRFDAWPERLAELKALDPCCGSGHFLVAALLML
ncbi:MAG: BREX-1 system adenine-specific DNA-methyltransferase PglX, partial [Chromatiaceae bacterium]|nr:BREX-1 system adenine-specific DNA-methyltransferase PglX [Candidatus Thioaporhodococcus sediminis]